MEIILVILSEEFRRQAKVILGVQKLLDQAFTAQMESSENRLTLDELEALADDD